MWTNVSAVKFICQRQNKTKNNYRIQFFHLQFQITIKLAATQGLAFKGEIQLSHMRPSVSIEFNIETT